MKLKRICEWCGKEFEIKPSEIKKGQGKFCSRGCYKKSFTKIECVCKQCGKIFEVIPSRIKKGGGKFCSLRCYNNAKKKKIKRVCLQCGKEFEVCPSLIKKGGGKFCSKKCEGENRKGENSPRWKPKIKCVCKQCNKTFERPSSEVNRYGGNFCSIKCRSEWYSEHYRGPDSPNWQGGVSFEPYCSKFNFAFKEYIREKFGRVCFLCQKTEEENGRKLDVHHVNYDKGCMCNDNSTCQFVPLCRSCNIKVNHNRKEWEAKINDMLHNKLNGWYV